MAFTSEPSSVSKPREGSESDRKDEVDMLQPYFEVPCRIFDRGRLLPRPLLLPKETNRDIQFKSIQATIEKLVRKSQTNLKHPRIPKETVKSLNEWRAVVAVTTPTTNKAAQQANAFNSADSALLQMPVEILELVDSKLVAKADRLAFRLAARKLLVLLSAVALKPYASELDSRRIRTLLGCDKFAIVCRLEIQGNLNLDYQFETNGASSITSKTKTTLAASVVPPGPFQALFDDGPGQPVTQPTQVLHEIELGGTVSQESVQTKLYACSCCETAHPASTFDTRELGNPPEMRVCFEEYPVPLCEHVSVRHRDICRMLMKAQMNESIIPLQIGCRAHGKSRGGSCMVGLGFFPDGSITYQNSFSAFVAPGTWTMDRAAQELHDFLNYGPVCDHMARYESWNIRSWLQFEHLQAPNGRQHCLRLACQERHCQSFVEMSIRRPGLVPPFPLHTRDKAEFRIQTVWQWPTMNAMPGYEWANIIDQMSLLRGNQDVWVTTPAPPAPHASHPSLVAGTSSVSFS